MPRHEQTFPVNGLDKSSILCICYSSFMQLDWQPAAAGADWLVAFTPKKWNANSQRITATVSGNDLVVSSETTAGEMLDITGKNKKNIATFIKAFEAATTNMQQQDYAANSNVLTALQQQTESQVKEEEILAAEVDKAMHLSGNNLYATYAIIAINVVVFLLMAMDGAGVIESNALVHLKWGSNFAPLTLSGDWWRLITNTFIHFGIIHLLLNMYCLYMAGVYLERLLGKPRYIAAYLCTGVLASLASLWWHKVPVNSAGASGAIFGLYGVFIAFLTTSLIPEKVRKSLFQSIGIFIVYNLAFGMKDGVDNAAHLGGLISGVVIGYLFVAGIKAEKEQRPAQWVLPLVLLGTIGIGMNYLQHHISSATERRQIMVELKNAGFKDNKKFTVAYDKFIELQDTALSPLKADLTDEERDRLLKQTSLPAWNEAETLALQMQRMDVSKEAQAKAGNVLLYIQLRKQEIEIIEQIVNHTADLKQLNDVRTRMNTVVETLR